VPPFYIRSALRSPLVYTLSLALAVALTSCDTEVNVNDDYAAIPIIYGLIDVSDSVHSVKINKTFLGTLDANDMATVRDSSEYTSVNAVIERYNGGDQPSQTFSLDEVEVDTKDSGLFYYPSQTIYQFEEEDLPSSGTYRLKVDINNGERSIEASTKLVHLIEIFRTTDWARLKATGLRFADSDTILSGHELSIVPPQNSKRVQVKALFHYWDVLANNGDTTQVARAVEFNLGTKTVENPILPKELRFFFTGSQFFESILAFVPDFDETPGLVQRIPENMDFEVTFAGEDLHFYMEVNEPSGDLNQEKPEYSNVEGGYGIFSSRLRMLFSERELNQEIRLSSATLDELTFGRFTGVGTKRFCNSSVGSGIPGSCF
jgi:hypothetical protein